MMPFGIDPSALDDPVFNAFLIQFPACSMISGSKNLREVHCGGRHLVYRGLREKDGRPVVLKTTVDDYPDSSQIQGLRNEYEILEPLDIEGVVRAYALENIRNGPILVLEDIEGIPLDQHLVQTHVDWLACLRLAVKISAAVEALHVNNIIHKNINPQSIIVDPDARMLPKQCGQRFVAPTASLTSPV
jgi:serine/threonine protein kinase